MKLLPENYLERQRRISINRAASRARGKKEAPRLQETSRTKPFVVHAPAHIGLHNRTIQSDLVKFLRALRKQCTRSKSVKINFYPIEKVYSTGMLLMLAEIDRTIRSTAPTCSISCNYPKDETAEKVFQQVGLLKILNKPHRLKITAEDKNVINWNYASDISVNQKSADALMKVIRHKIPKGYQKLVTGVGEAMDNAVHHAYIRSRGDRLSGLPEADERRWWVFAEVLDGWLHVVFCDLGLGIPVTLPERWAEQLTDILRLTTLSPGKRDSRMIRRSLELGRTRTEQNHRGKGLKRNILKAAEELGGRLLIYSNMGVVGVDCRDGAPTYTLWAYDESILGTVIQWSIPIAETQDLEDEHDQDHNR